jgi:hypothetical protein
VVSGRQLPQDVCWELTGATGDWCTSHLSQVSGGGGGGGGAAWTDSCPS